MHTIQIVILVFYLSFVPQRITLSVTDEVVGTAKYNNNNMWDIR